MTGTFPETRGWRLAKGALSAVARLLREEERAPLSPKPPPIMKTSVFTSLVLLATFVYVPPSMADSDMSVDLFYVHLEPHGSWFETDDYGYVWQPHDIDAEWFPYGEGRWVYTDVGWTWFSSEPYGWAVYHYGRWSNVHDLGWVWVPGTEWGPGWVSWRSSPAYVGWAPLPPEADFSSLTGLGSWVDRYYDIGPGHYRFVEIGNFGAPGLNNVFVDRRQNFMLVNQTTNITNITYRENFVFNGGPGYDETASSSRHPIPRYRLQRRRDVAREGRIDGRWLSPSIDGDILTVTDLPLSGSPQGQAPKIERKIEKAEMERGWRGAGSREEVAATRKRIQDEVGLPEGLPELAVRAGREEGTTGGDPRGRGKPAGRVASAEREAMEQGRIKGRTTGGPPVVPVTPTTPGEVGKGKGRAVKNLPPEPHITTLPGDLRSRENEGNGRTASPSAARPMPPTEERRESKGTKKDPAAPGTQVEPAPSAPGTPVIPRPPAPGQEQGREKEGVPAPASPPRNGSDQNPVESRRMPPAPGGSATPPLPSEGTPPRSSLEGRAENPNPPTDRNGPPQSKSADRQAPLPKETSPSGKGKRENERR